MSDNTSAEPTITEQQETSVEEELFDVFETEKAESDYAVKTFDCGIAARQVHRNGPDLQVITVDDEKPEVEIPKNVFNTIMNNLSIMDSPGKTKPNKEKSESFKVPLLSPTSKKDELGGVRSAGHLGSAHSLTSLDDAASRDRTDVRSRKSPNTSTWRGERKKSPDRAGPTRKLRINEAKTGVRTSSSKLDNSKGLKTSKSNPALRSTNPKTSK